MSFRSVIRSGLASAVLFSLIGLAGTFPARAQVSACIKGIVSDPSGAAVAAANITVRNSETGVVRTAASNSAGDYLVLALPVGQYEVLASKSGFQDFSRSGIYLNANQEVAIDIHLQVSQVKAAVTVTEDAPIVNTTTSDISGLVGAHEIKQLPLNGRSYDLLLTLNPGIVNFTSQKTGGTGISNSTTANNFSVSGNRPQQNLFLLNGVEFTGAAENNMTPGGPSGQLLGVDAVREFNVQRDSYGAEFGKHPGGQVIIVTQSGSNNWHGSLFEFVRNSALDAANYFDQGGPPPFQRNQFGASLGGAVVPDHSFFFANYEGFRQDLHQTSVAFVPSLPSRAAAIPAVQPYLNLWPTPLASAPDFNGISPYSSSPLQTVREDFFTARLDHNFSSKDSLAFIYTIDDGSSTTATPANPYSSDILALREQVFSAEETHVFSPSLLNTFRFGFSRAAYFFAGEPTPGTPAAAVPGFLKGLRVGAVVVGGSAASNPQAQVGLAGSNNGSNLPIKRNIFTYEDRVSLTRGRHQFSFGVWFQQFQSNEVIALSQYGQATFPSLTQFITTGVASSFLYDPAPTQMHWRSLFAAFYAEDVIRFSPRLTLSLGFRGESSTGWNEARGSAANYTFPNGVISNTPHTGDNFFTKNNATFLPQPRISLAWSPLGPKTVLRAGFGMYNDLQDALGYRADQNAPFNPVYTLSNFNVSKFPIDTTAPVPAGAKLVPGGVQPNMQTPTLISWSLRLQRELSPNTSLTVGYVGSHGYHELVGVDGNPSVPVVCPTAPCPAVYPTYDPATYDPTQPPSPTNVPPTIGFVAGSPYAGAPVPAGSFYIPNGAPKANPTIANTWTWFSVGTASYHALQVDITRRFSHDISFRGVYTFSKSLDDGDSINQTTAANAPGLVSNPYDLAADKGLATFNVTHMASINALYALPFGHGERYASDLSGFSGHLVSGWSLASIVTIQSGFPLTPQLSYNPSNNGDTRNPVRPFINPDFHGPLVLGKASQWFNPAAFIAPPSNSGFWGNAGRSIIPSPGLGTWDFSVIKDTGITERAHLQFRAEFFNLLNRANFNTPNLIVFTPPTAANPNGLSGTAGAITSTSTTARQLQFALKLLF
ncbi:MAG TPA: carboxypeptidase regulatory-like domain-containing protein [Dongiaceae bacterium]|nr:carboxypeptidase regulatory-like domain-containing protein [Dongiaceae bacterium]